MLLDKLPLYGIRDYVDIVEEGNFKIISTYRARYVLDILNLTGDYWERRLKSLDMILPYKLYPLKNRFDFIEQLITHKTRIFIDREGNLIKYVPYQFRYLKTDRILAKWEAKNGDTMIRVNGCPTTFRTNLKTDRNFLTYVKIKNKHYMFKLADTKEPTVRKKI